MRLSRCADRAATAGRLWPFLLLAGLLLCLAGCGGEASGRATADGVVRVELEPVGGSGAAGTVSLVPAGGGMEVRLALRDVPDPGAVYVGAIYEGACPEETGTADPRGAVYRFVHGGGHEAGDDEGVVQTLTSVDPGPDGGGRSATPLPTRVKALLSGGPRYVDVHGEGGSAVACADLPSADASDA